MARDLDAVAWAGETEAGAWEETISTGRAEGRSNTLEAALGAGEAGVGSGEVETRTAEGALVRLLVLGAVG